MGYSAEQYEALYAELGKDQSIDLHHERVSAQRIRAIKAGEMLYLSSFPIWKTAADGGRAKKACPSRDVQRRLNQRRSRLKTEMLMNANFGEGSFYLTMTYTETPRAGMRIDAEYYRDEPEDEREAQANMSRYIRTLKQMVKRLGGDPARLKWLYVTEATYTRHANADMDHARYHHHMVVDSDVGNGVHLTRDQVEDTWRGMPFASGRTRCDRVQPDKNGISALAAYFTKTEDGKPDGKDALGRERYRQLCHHSRNLVRPEEHASVSDRKISRYRVSKVVKDVLRDGVQIFEALYPDYECTEAPTVYISDYCAGAYINCRMRRRR